MMKVGERTMAHCIFCDRRRRFHVALRSPATDRQTLARRCGACMTIEGETGRMTRRELGAAAAKTVGVR